MTTLVVMMTLRTEPPYALVQVQPLAGDDLGRDIKSFDTRASLFEFRRKETTVDPPKSSVTNYVHHTPIFHAKSLAFLRVIQQHPHADTDSLWHAGVLKIGQACSDAAGTYIVTMVTPHCIRAMACEEEGHGVGRLLKPVLHFRGTVVCLY